MATQAEIEAAAEELHLHLIHMAARWMIAASMPAPPGLDWTRVHVPRVLRPQATQ